MEELWRDIEEPKGARCYAYNYPTKQRANNQRDS